MHLCNGTTVDQLFIASSPGRMYVIRIMFLKTPHIWAGVDSTLRTIILPYNGERVHVTRLSKLS